MPENLDETIPIQTESLACAQLDTEVEERLREEIALRKQQACPRRTCLTSTISSPLLQPHRCITHPPVFTLYQAKRCSTSAPS